MAGKQPLEYSCFVFDCFGGAPEKPADNRQKIRACPYEQLAVLCGNASNGGSWQAKAFRLNQYIGRCCRRIRFG